MQSSLLRTITALAVLLLSIGMIGYGTARVEHRVFDEAEDEFGMALHRRVSEKQLVIDATFSGVVRKNGRLYTTYDRSKPLGKQACLT